MSEHTPIDTDPQAAAPGNAGPDAPARTTDAKTDADAHAAAKRAEDEAAALGDFA